jgi:poly-gamma-glutamate synthesis protein (capsule biosynthesis protein)
MNFIKTNKNLLCINYINVLIPNKLDIDTINLFKKYNFELLTNDLVVLNDWQYSTIMKLKFNNAKYKSLVKGGGCKKKMNPFVFKQFKFVKGGGILDEIVGSLVMGRKKYKPFIENKNVYHQTTFFQVRKKIDKYIDCIRERKFVIEYVIKITFEYCVLKIKSGYIIKLTTTKDKYQYDQLMVEYKAYEYFKKNKTPFISSDGAELVVCNNKKYVMLKYKYIEGIVLWNINMSDVSDANVNKLYINIIEQIIRVIHFLEKRKILHNDFHPGNVILTKIPKDNKKYIDGNIENMGYLIKIIDFQFAHQYERINSEIYNPFVVERNKIYKEFKLSFGISHKFHVGSDLNKMFNNLQKYFKLDRKLRFFLQSLIVKNIGHTLFTTDGIPFENIKTSGAYLDNGKFFTLYKKSLKVIKLKASNISIKKYENINRINNLNDDIYNIFRTCDTYLYDFIEQTTINDSMFPIVKKESKILIAYNGINNELLSYLIYIRFKHLRKVLAKKQLDTYGIPLKGKGYYIDIFCEKRGYSGSKELLVKYFIENVLNKKKNYIISGKIFSKNIDEINIFRKYGFKFTHDIIVHNYYNIYDIMIKKPIMNKFSSNLIKISMIGDVMIGRSFNKLKNVKLVIEDKIRKHLKKSDLLVMNLETTITSSTIKTKIPPGKKFHFKTKPAIAKKIFGVGKYKLCENIYSTLANNHILDYENKGLIDTIMNLSTLNIHHNGAYFNINLQNVLKKLNINNTTIGFLAAADHYKEWAAGKYKTGIWYIDPSNDNMVKNVLKIVKDSKLVCDFLIFSCHMQENYVEKIDANVKKFYKLLIDNGVDIVHGHSPHHSLPIEKYKNGFICYSLGDFINDYDVNYGLIADFTINTNTKKITHSQQHKIKIENMKVKFD